MLFSSMTFLYVFLPVVLLLILLLDKKFHNIILLIASFIFYAWGEPKYALIMMLTILINYIGAIFIAKFQKFSKCFLWITVLLNLCILGYFKYFNFVVENINSICHANFNFINVVMPIGISFYTFQALSYVIDVYRKECRAQYNLLKVALYICLFPQLVAGPIIKYHDISEQIDSREIDIEKVRYGVKRFIFGLAKKVLIANTMASLVDKIFAQNPDSFIPIVGWLGALGYSMQIYFDFSGYSDMAIGLGLILGFRFMENFNYPYISKSVSEFWRRWHISLSTWFKQYVYIPMGGNKEGIIKTVRNLGFVFLLTGIWHGASWTFVVWGLWHGFFIILEKLLKFKELENKHEHSRYSFLFNLYCLLVVMFGWIIFRSDNLEYAFSYILNLFGLVSDSEEMVFSMHYFISSVEFITLIIAIVCSIPFFKNITNQKTIWGHIAVNVWLLILLILSSASIASGTYNPFIYFRF